MRACSVRFLGLALAVVPGVALCQSTATPPPTTVLHTEVRRVVVDVVVTDRSGASVPGLTREDFALKEDGREQKVLSFEAQGFKNGMDYTPPKLPAEPPNTFLNLPSTPERGPLYILLYDLNNMDNEDQMALTVNQHGDQMFGRQQLVKFIKSKPEGARFEIYVWSDRLQLLQGFTSDKQLLYAAIDPKHPGPHIPMVYLMGQNTGRGNSGATLGVLDHLGRSVDGLPGRKNLIWFSGGFPLSLFPTEMDDDRSVRQLKATLDLLARNQVAIYPVDVRGVVSADVHTINGIASEGAIVSQAGAGGLTSSGGGNSSPVGVNLLQGSYNEEDEIARQTGGRAFYSDNDLAEELGKATETGSSFYTLSYAPSDHDYHGQLRTIQVALEKKGYTLDYRRFYYALASEPEPAIAKAPRGAAVARAPEVPRRPTNDSLSANMQLGAPMAHSLIFALHVEPSGAPVPATGEQMAALAAEPAFFSLHKKLIAGKVLPPVPLQTYVLQYSVFAKQFGSQSGPLSLELAAAAYDADGSLIDDLVTLGSRSAPDAAPGAAPSAVPSAEPAHFFRVEEKFAVPLSTKVLRVAVHDLTTDRIGAMEVRLPLAPEGTASVRPNP